MNMGYRAILVLLFGLLKPKIHPSNAYSRLYFRVGLRDLDMNVHMNNGRMISLCDLGKIDIMSRCGLLKLILKRKVQAVISGHGDINYFSSAKYGDVLMLETKLDKWDEKRIYVSHRIYDVKRQKVIAELSSTCAFVKSRTVISPSEAYSHTGNTIPEIGYWDDAEMVVSPDKAPV